MSGWDTDYALDRALGGLPYECARCLGPSPRPRDLCAGCFGEVAAMVGQLEAAECRACGDPCDADAETCWRCDIHGTAPIPASYPSDRER